MTDKITISDVYNIAEMTLEIQSGATLVTGLNSAGKTNFSRVLSALAAMDANPSKLSAAATDQRHYVRNKSEVGEGKATLTTESGHEVVWEAGKGIRTSAEFDPLSSRYAVGLVDFTLAQAEAKRAEMWQDILLPSEPEKLLAKAKDIPENHIKSILKIINSGPNGWKRAHETYVGHRLAAQSRWQEITGKPRYGVNVASKWTPEHWRAELQATSEDALRTELVEAQERHDEYISIVRISEEKKAEAENIRDNLLPKEKAHKEELDKSLADIQTRIDKLNDAERQLNANIDECNRKIRAHKETLDQPTNPPLTCPLCEGGLRMMQREGLVAFEPADPEQIEKAQAAVDALVKECDGYYELRSKVQGGIRKVGGERDSVLGDLAVSKGTISGYMTAIAILDIRDSQVGETDETIEAQLKEAIRKARVDLDAFERYQNAKAQHEARCEYDRICSALGPQGVRADTMRKSLDGVRKSLDAINRVSGWSKKISITDSFQVTSDGRPIQLCAKNEILKAQWALQIICGLMTGSKYIILDEADTLKDDNWTGMVTLIDHLLANKKNAGRCIVVCATSTDAPDGWGSVLMQDA